MTAQLFCEITTGPSREELFDAFMYAYDKGCPRYVVFGGTTYTVEHGMRTDLVEGNFTARIVGIHYNYGDHTTYTITIRTDAFNTLIGKDTTMWYDPFRRVGVIALDQ